MYICINVYICINIYIYIHMHIYIYILIIYPISPLALSLSPSLFGSLFFCLFFWRRQDVCAEMQAEMQAPAARLQNSVRLLPGHCTHTRSHNRKIHTHTQATLLQSHKQACRQRRNPNTPRMCMHTYAHIHKHAQHTLHKHRPTHPAQWAVEWVIGRLCTPLLWRMLRRRMLLLPLPSQRQQRLQWLAQWNWGEGQEEEEEEEKGRGRREVKGKEVTAEVLWR